MEKVALAWSMKDGWEITSQKGREQREQRGSGAEQVAECGGWERCGASRWVEGQGQRAQGACTPHQGLWPLLSGVTTRHPRGFNQG